MEPVPAQSEPRPSAARHTADSPSTRAHSVWAPACSVALAAALAGEVARAPGALGLTLGQATTAPGAAAWVAALACAARAVLSGLGSAPRRPSAGRVLVGAALGLAWALSADLLLGLELTRRRAVATGLAAALVVEGAAALGTWRPRSVAVGSALVGVAALLGAEYRSRQPLRSMAQATGGNGPPIVLVTLDTTRRDALGCYGAGPERTPRLDRFANDSVLFTRAVSPSPHTHPAIASLLTGRAPLEHRSLSGTPHLAPEATTLAEHCRAHGYQTAAFLDNPWLHGGFGLERGYAHLESSARIERVERWLDARAPGPFLLHVHFFHPHGPYEASPAEAAPLAAESADPSRVGRRASARQIRAGEVPTHHALKPADIAWMRALQATEVRRMDRDFGALVDALEARGLLDRAVIVVAADHGEEFGERGGLHHSHTLFSELVDVPLIVRTPGGAPRVEGAPTSLVHVHDLVTRAARLPPLAPPQPAGPLVSVRVRQAGRHLLRATDGHSSLHVRMTPGSDALERAFFDLAADPGELHDLLRTHGLPGMPRFAGAQGEAADALLASESVQRALAALRALRFAPAQAPRGTAGGQAGRAPRRSARAQADLRALGYAR